MGSLVVLLLISLILVPIIKAANRVKSEPVEPVWPDEWEAEEQEAVEPVPGFLEGGVSIEAPTEVVELLQVNRAPHKVFDLRSAVVADVVLNAKYKDQ